MAVTWRFFGLRSFHIFNQWNGVDWRGTLSKTLRQPLTRCRSVSSCARYTCVYVNSELRHDHYLTQRRKSMVEKQDAKTFYRSFLWSLFSFFPHKRDMPGHPPRRRKTPGGRPNKEVWEWLLDLNTLAGPVLLSSLNWYPWYSPVCLMYYSKKFLILINYIF